MSEDQALHLSTFLMPSSISETSCYTFLSYLYSRDLKQFKRISLSYFLYYLSLLYDSYLKYCCCCVLKEQCEARFEQLLSLALPEHEAEQRVVPRTGTRGLCTGCGGQQVCNGEACCASHRRASYP